MQADANGETEECQHVRALERDQGQQVHVVMVYLLLLPLDQMLLTWNKSRALTTNQQLIDPDPDPDRSVGQRIRKGLACGLKSSSQSYDSSGDSGLFGFGGGLQVRL